MSSRKGLDWEAIRRDWELGRWTSRELGAKFSCSHTAINKRAVGEQWQKNLAKAVHARASAMLAVDGQLSDDDHRLVEESATLVVNVVRSQKAALRTQTSIVERLTAVVGKHLARLEQTTWIDEKKVWALSQLTDSLSRALVRLMEMERKTYGLDSPEKGTDEGIDGVIDAARTNAERVRRFRELVGRADPGVAE